MKSLTVDAATGAQTEKNLSAPEAAAFDAVRQVGLAPAAQAKSDLAATDTGMTRVIEDLFAALKAKGVLVDADLPQAARDKISQRQTMRGQL